MRRRTARTSAPPTRRARGFTLLEVLLAFVVFALAFATVLEILSASMRSTMRAREYSEAALTAQSLMDTVGTELVLTQGSYAGEAEGGYRWILDITPFDPPDGDPYILEMAELSGTQLFWVDLRVEWGEGRRARQVAFTTVRGIVSGALRRTTGS